MPRAPQDLVLSYLALRRTVGILGMALPTVVMVGAWKYGLLDSISAYYYTNMGNTFVGLLFAIGVFMAAYHGYDWYDEVVSDAACVGALGVALFPTDRSSVTSTAIGKAHYGFAALLFVAFALFCLWLFPKSQHSDDELKTEAYKRKRQRNWAYRFCGAIIMACILLMFIGHLVPDVKHYPSKFWLETFAIEAFGASWLIKGQTLLADRRTEREAPPRDARQAPEAAGSRR